MRTTSFKLIRVAIPADNTDRGTGLRLCLPGGGIEIALENLLLLTDSRTARALVTVLLFALALGFLYVARATLIAFLFAIFFAYLMSPLVNRLEKVLRGRGRAIAVIYALLLALVVVFFVAVGPKVTREGAKLGQSLPALLTNLSSGQIAKQLGEEHGWNSKTTELAQSFLVSHSDDISEIAQRIGLRMADVAKQAWLFFVVPLLVDLLFKGWPRLSATSCSRQFNLDRSANFWRTCSTI